MSLFTSHPLPSLATCASPGQFTEADVVAEGVAEVKAGVIIEGADGGGGLTVILETPVRSCKRRKDRAGRMV